MSIGVSFAAWLFKGTRVQFYKDLSEALRHGDQLAARIEKLADRASNEGDMQGPLFQLWLRRMDDQSFTEAIVGTVPDSDVMILQAAERSGDLVSGLKFTASVIAKTKIMISALRKAVLGSAFMAVFLLGVLAGFSFYGIPLIEEIVPPKAWPWIGQQLKGLAQFITESGGTALLCAGAIGAAFYWSLRNWYGRARVAVDRIFLPYTIYRDFSGSMFLVSLAALMKNGTGLNDALDILSEKASPWLLWHIRQIQLGLDYQSESTGEAFATGLFNKRLTWRIIDFGERAKSDFAEAMEIVGIETIDDVMEGVKAKANVLNRFLLIVNACLIMFIVAGALLTLFETQEQLNKQINSNQAAAK